MPTDPPATKRLPQILLIVTFLGFSWLAMQIVHEAGHVLVAWLTGGTVTKVILHPLLFSRTDLGENPHPLAVVWGGPLAGLILPLLVFGLAAAGRLPGLYLPRFFAGFCLVANGVYIGTGWLLADAGDPRDMIKNGSPIWLLVFFGLVTVPLGLYLWHRQGPRFGFAEAKGNVHTRAAITSAALFLIVIVAELMWNAR